MLLPRIIIAFVLLGTIGFCADLQTLRWIAPANLEIDGLPWFSENKGEFFRFPLRSQDNIPHDVWNLAKSPSGARIRLHTDSTTLAVRLEYPSGPEMRNMHAFGQTGVDLYVDGSYWGTATADKDAKPGKIYEHVYFDLHDQPRHEREITLYLSLYKPVKVLGIGADPEAKITAAKPFAAAKPVVFYGTSITQGGCASHPGTAYQAIVGRMLNVDFVNLGFSGNGKGEPEVAKLVAEIDASAFVLDFAQNNPTVDSLRQVYAPFIETLRSKYPQTPIIVITPIFAARENQGPDAKLDGMRALIRQVAAARIASGDTHLQIVEGTDLLGPGRADGLVDGTHPSDLGFQWMAEGLAPRLKKILGL
jgi:lysophospholipase L1-like esterase